MNLYSVLKKICKSMSHGLSDFPQPSTVCQPFESIILFPNHFPALSDLASNSNDQVKTSDIPQASPEKSEKVSPSKEDPFYIPPWHEPRPRPANYSENCGALDILIRVAEPGSLRHAVISNPRKCLEVPPELWTSEHLELFNVTYKVLAPEEYMTNTLIELSAFRPDHTSQKYDHLKYCVRALHFDNYEESGKDRRMYDIFNDLLRCLLKDSHYKTQVPKVSEYRRQGLLFNYGDKYDTKRTINLYCRQVAYDTDLEIMRLAYVDKSFLRQNWKKDCLLRRRRRVNKKRSKCQNRDKYPFFGEENAKTPIDPYYVGILIMMAQCGLKKLTNAGYTDVGAEEYSLFTPSEDRKSLVLYRASVTPTFLMKFSDPYKKFDDGLVVTREDYPIRYETAVISAIMKILERPEDLLKDFVFEDWQDPTEIDDFETGPPPNKGKKRKAESSSTANDNKKRKGDHVRASESQNNFSQGTKRKAAGSSERPPPSKKRKENVVVEQAVTEHQDTQLDHTLESPTSPPPSPPDSPSAESTSIPTQSMERISIPPSSSPVSSPHSTPPSSPPSPGDAAENRPTTTPYEGGNEDRCYSPGTNQTTIDDQLLETVYESACAPPSSPLFNLGLLDALNPEFYTQPTPSSPPPSLPTSEFEHYQERRSMPPPPSPIRTNPGLEGTRRRSRSLGPIDPDIPSPVPEFEATAGPVNPQLVATPTSNGRRTPVRKRGRDEDDVALLSPLLKRSRRSH